MSDRVDVIRHDPKDSSGGQTRKVWTFLVMDTPRPTVYLNAYAEEHRAPRKRKWVAQRVYHRIAVNRYSDTFVISEEPDVPVDVVEEALADLRSKLVFRKWSRR